MTIVCKQMRMHNICPGIYLPYKWWYHYNYAFAKPRVSKPICKYTYILKQNKVLNCIIHIQWQNTLIDGSAENVLFYILAGWICRHCGSWICRRYCRGQHNAHSRTLSHIHSYLVWKMVVIQESWKADILLFCLIRMNELFRFFYNTNLLRCLLVLLLDTKISWWIELYANWRAWRFSIRFSAVYRQGNVYW